MRTMERQTGGFIFIVALALLPFLKAPAAAMESEAAVRFIDRLGNEAFSTLQQPGMTPLQREEAIGRILG